MLGTIDIFVTFDGDGSFTERETTWPRLNHGGWVTLPAGYDYGSLYSVIRSVTRHGYPFPFELYAMMERVYKPKMPLAFFVSSWIILEQRPLFWRASVINNRAYLSHVKLLSLSPLTEKRNSLYTKVYAFQNTIYLDLFWDHFRLSYD